MQKEINEVCWRTPGKINSVFHMQCIFKTLVVSPRPTQAFCEDNNSHMHVLKVFLAFSTAWDERSSTIRAARNFPQSISASVELHFRGCSGAKWPLFPLSVLLPPLQLLLLFLIVSERGKSLGNTSPFLTFFAFLI